MAATLTDPLLGHLVDGRYEVLSRIARGGMATVYLATDRRLDREVALKVMHPHLAEGGAGSDFVARFRREARAAARLTHPGLVGVFDQGVDGETSYLTMEYVDGTNLRRHLGEQGALSVREALTTAEAILDALAAAHRTGLVHRDVKPENVLLATDGRIKVADFGLARAVTEVTATATGTVLGTVAYLAPELVSHGVSDPRTDVYAVGILLFEMITGRQPFTGATPIQVAYQHVNSDIPSPSDSVRWLPAEIDELVEALAARDPDDRPVHAGAALTLVRRTRIGLDEETLDRRAEVAPSIRLPGATAGVPMTQVPTTSDEDGDEPAAGGTDSPAPAPRALHDPDATDVLLVPGQTRPPSPDDEPDAPGRTVALQIGTGLTTAEDDDDEPQPEVEPSVLAWRRRVRLVLTLVAVVALGGMLAVWYGAYGPGAYVTIPSGIVGATAEQAEAVLVGEGLDPSTTSVFHPTVEAGTVVAVTPGEGDRVIEGGEVELAVSKGPDMRTVPEGLAGTTTQSAVNSLTRAGFTVTETLEEHSDTVEAGLVIGLSLEPGAEHPEGTEVTVTSSLGPAPVVVISVVGLEKDRAVELLEGDGLRTKIVEEFTEDWETYPAGVVMAQDPAASADAFRTDLVTLTVSKGAPLVEMPNVFGKNFDSAKQELEALGFEVQREELPTGAIFNLVASQSVAAGEKAPKGTVIVLRVG